MLFWESSPRKLIQNNNLLTSTLNRWTATVPHKFSDLMFPLYITCTATNFHHKGDISPWLIRKVLLPSFKLHSSTKDSNVNRPAYKLCINLPVTFLPSVSDQRMFNKTESEVHSDFYSYELRLLNSQNPHLSSDWRAPPCSSALFL